MTYTFDIIKIIHIPVVNGYYIFYRDYVQTLEFKVIIA